MAATSRAVLADQAETADPAALLSLEAAASREVVVPVAHPDASATRAVVAEDLVVGASMDPAEVAVEVPSDVADPAVGVIAVETAAETAIMMLSMRTCFSIGTRLASRISVRIIVNFIEFR